MNSNPPTSLPKNRDDTATPLHLPPIKPDIASITHPDTSSRASTPESPTKTNEYSSRLTTPRPGGDDNDTQSAAALALLGLSMRTSSEAPSSSTDHPRSPGLNLDSIGMSVTLSSASDSSSTNSTGSTKMSSVRKRRSSESSGQTEDTGRSKRTRESEESGGSPPTPKAKTDGWTDEMKRVYEQGELRDLYRWELQADTAAAFALPPSGREQRRLFGDMRGRNEQLGLWVTLEVGTYCGRKRISSHSQTLKNHHGTNPELKRFLTTDIAINPNSPTDPSAWPLRLKQIVHRAYSSLPNPPPLPPVAELDLANIAIPAIPVRVLRKDGVEVEMTLPDAIEYDKADQRLKNREKKPVRGRPGGGKIRRTATPTHSRDSSYVANGPRQRPQPYRPSPSTNQNYSSPGGPSSAPPHSRSASGRDSDRQTRYRQFANNNSDLPPHYNSGEAGPSNHLTEDGPSSAPVYWERKAEGGPGRSSPPRSGGQPMPNSNLPALSYDGSEYSDEEDRLHRPHQPHAPSLDFILAKPNRRSSPPPEAAAAPRQFWKSG